MSARFYSEDAITASVGEVVEIRGSEQQHMTKVMRLGVGDGVTLFDGSDAEYEATISEVTRQAVQLTIDTEHDVDRELPFQLTLGVALPKGDRQQWLVEKCVELGVTAITPLVTSRGVAQPSEKAAKRIQRWIVAASKQCRRNRLMQVTETRTIEQFFAGATESVKANGAGNVLIAHPKDDATSLHSVSQQIPAGSTQFVAIGPEGGFTNEEVAQAGELGGNAMTMGKRILRIETAAVAVAASFVFGNSNE